MKLYRNVHQEIQNSSRPRDVQHLIHSTALEKQSRVSKTSGPSQVATCLFPSAPRSSSDPISCSSDTSHHTSEMYQKAKGAGGRGDEFLFVDTTFVLLLYIVFLLNMLYFIYLYFILYFILGALVALSWDKRPGRGVEIHWAIINA